MHVFLPFSYKETFFVICCLLKFCTNMLCIHQKHSYSLAKFLSDLEIGMAYLLVQIIQSFLVDADHLELVCQYLGSIWY